MKVPPKTLDAFVKKPPEWARAVLVYGPDEGLVRERLNALTATVVKDIRDPFNVAEFPASTLSDNPARLMDEALSISMLGDRRVVRVHNASDDISAAVKGVLAALDDRSNFVVIAAGELTPRSSLRILFENAENAAAVPCYVDDARDISRIIADELREAGYTISSEALAHMAANVVGDRMVARSEAEKLMIYMGDKKAISFDDVTACVGDSADLSLDDLSRHVASGKFTEAERIMTSVLNEGMPAVTVLRTLQNYFMKLHITKSRIAAGENHEIALKKLKPPLFFKVKPAFEAQLAGWSLLQMEQALTMLASAEARCKQTASEPAIVCGRAILSLSQIGARAVGRRR